MDVIEDANAGGPYHRTAGFEKVAGDRPRAFCSIERRSASDGVYACASRADGGHQLVDRIERHFETHGFGLYAAELRADRSFVGFIGLSIPAFDAPFMPAVEIGWRLGFECWGKGLATEGARSVVRYAFERLGLDGLVSFTTPLNLRSLRVMEKLGMTHGPFDDFEHPNMQVGHWLRPHALYRLSRARWTESRPLVAWTQGVVLSSSVP